MFFNKEKKLPQSFKKYFWEIDFNKFDPFIRPFYAIERFLEYGDKDAVSWMLENFKKNQIIEALKQSRQISPKSANFWSIYFNINKKDVLCLNKLSPTTQSSIWKY